MVKPAVQRRWTLVAVSVVTAALLAAIAVLFVRRLPAYLANEVFDNDVPSCDVEPVVLEWAQQEGLWQRSATFDLFEDSQRVQVDVTLQRDDGGVIQVGKTVYVVVAGGSVPSDRDEDPMSAQPFRGTIVGRGVDGVNEQVTLEAGQWQLIVQGGASAPEVRWPC